MGFGLVQIEVDGKPVEADLDEQLEIGDVSTDMEKVAAQMAYWGAVWASAEAEKLSADAYYRQWRAEAGRSLLESDPKLAEWKVKQDIEAQPKFAKIKQGLATAMRNATLSKAIYESFKTKASMLQSKGAMLRSELDATGMSTKSPSNERPRSARAQRQEDQRKERTDHMKGIFKAKKKT